MHWQWSSIGKKDVMRIVCVRHANWHGLLISTDAAWCRLNMAGARWSGP